MEISKLSMGCSVNDNSAIEKKKDEKITKKRFHSTNTSQLTYLKTSTTDYSFIKNIITENWICQSKITFWSIKLISWEINNQI